MRVVGLWVGALCCASVARADTTLTFDVPVPADPVGTPFVLQPFEVPAGVAELTFHPNDQSDANATDFGLYGPDRVLRGWAGSNGGDGVLNELAASPGYIPGVITPGTWNVIIGFPFTPELPGTIHIEVTLRDAPTLAPQADRGPFVAPAPLSAAPGWYAGDFHVHSEQSGDARPSLDEVADYVVASGLDFVELSEHNTTAHLSLLSAVQRRHPTALLVPGIEWTSYRGHAIAIGVTEPVPFTLGIDGLVAQQAVDAIHDQGGLFSPAHPTLDIGSSCMGCAWEHPVDVMSFDGLEVSSGSVDKLGAVLLVNALAMWDAQCDAGAHVAALGGSADHTGGTATGAVGSRIGEPTTMVFAEELSVDGIVEGVRQNRTVVKLGGMSDPMVELDAQGREGDTIYADRATVTARVTGGAGAQLLVVRDGLESEVADIPSDDWTWTGTVDAPATGQARVRVHVLRDGVVRTITSHLWVEAPVERADDGGCGCSVETTASSASWVALAAWAATRRRRQWKVRPV